MVDGGVNLEKLNMTQDERWMANWKAIIDFMEANKRRPSKFVDSERGLRNWWKQQQKLVNAGELRPERMEKFKEMIQLGEKYKHKNQYA